MSLEQDLGNRMDLIGHGHGRKTSGTDGNMAIWLIYPLRMVMFHSFLYVYQRVSGKTSSKYHPGNASLFLGWQWEMANVFKSVLFWPNRWTWSTKQLLQEKHGTF